MNSNNQPIVHDNWWPEILKFISDEQPVNNESVITAEIGHPVGSQSYKHQFSALVDVDKSDEILNHPGGIGDRVLKTSPYLDNSETEERSIYYPRFWISAVNIVPKGLEPLTLSWDSANWTYLIPDQNFLMTYGLIPRHVSSESGFEIFWDDLKIPRYEVVKSIPISDFSNGKSTYGFIVINRDYLQDYATIRNCQIIQVFYSENRGEPSPEIYSLLDEQKVREFSLPGRLIQIRFINENPPIYLAKVWGTRLLISPDSAPITSSRQQLENLLWPGIEGEINRKVVRSLGFEEIYVLDTVLGNFEGKNEYSIIPESGSVGYRNQWSIGYSRRLGRDIIGIELKKLYEGVPREIVKIYHQHVIPPPKENFEALMSTPNVATRARRIVFSILALGEKLSHLASLILSERIEPIDLIGLSRHELEYQGWWEDSAVEPVTRHIPLDMSKDNFLIRCKLLDQLVIEGLQERRLRSLLITLGVNDKTIEEFRSLRLFSILIELTQISIDTGLNLIDNSEEIVSRISLKRINTHMPVLFNLHALRSLESHRHGSNFNQRLSTALNGLKIDQVSSLIGWGIALDKLYDAMELP